MTKEEIIQEYINGKSIAWLSQNSKYNYRQVREFIVQANIPIRGGRKKKTLTNEQLKILKQRYCEESEDLKTLAQEFSWDKETLRNLIKELGLTKKTTNRVNKRIISDYFSCIDSPDKAYFIGLLFTDGNVSKIPGKQGRIRISLQAKDRDILDKLKTVLQIDSDLILDNRGNQCYSLEFCDEQIYQDLQKYNIVPNKTYEINSLPKNIPQKFLRDFIRGLIDGDGGISFSENKSSDVTLNFTSYHEGIVNELVLLIDNLINKTEHNKPFYTTAWHCQWRGYKQVTKILDILYNDSTMYIQRKYDLYKTLLNRN